MPPNNRCVNFRMIAPPAHRETVLGRLAALCEELEMACTVSKDEPYWKMPDRMETEATFGACPTWNYGRWSEVYRRLFGQELTIEWETGENILFFTYPPVGAEGIWVQFLIPSECFWPKPSRDIRH